MAKGLRKKNASQLFYEVRLRAGAASHQMHRMHSEQGVFDIDLLLFLLNCICLVRVPRPSPTFSHSPVGLFFD